MSSFLVWSRSLNKWCACVKWEFTDDNKVIMIFEHGGLTYRKKLDPNSEHIQFREASPGQASPSEKDPDCAYQCESNFDRPSASTLHQRRGRTQNGGQSQVERMNPVSVCESPPTSGSDEAREKGGRVCEKPDPWAGHSKKGKRGPFYQYPFESVLFPIR